MSKAENSWKITFLQFLVYIGIVKFKIYKKKATYRQKIIDMHQIFQKTFKLSQKNE